MEVTKSPAINDLESLKVVKIQKPFDNTIQAKFDKLTHLEKHIIILTNRIKTLEKDIEFKELEGKFRKHYEQSRRR